MTRKFALLAALAALNLTAPAFAPAFAQDKTPPIPKGVFYKGQGGTQFLMKDRLIGQKVTTAKGDGIGTIEDVIMGRDNSVDGVIIGVGGFLGAGEKQIGVHFSALNITNADGKRSIVLDTSKEVLAALEPYKRLEAKKTLLEKAGEAASAAAAKTKELAGKGAVMAKDAAAKVEEAGKAAMEKAKAAATPAPAAPKP